VARAYLDMGDRDTARSLLQEVASRGDTPAVRQEAARLLEDLA
jgi:pilus assembly protein FimV